jgi:dimethylamine monooxygenase subunit A
MPFDFDAAVTAPFRMQPGLRRMAPGVAHLTPLKPGSRHQREKLAVFSALWPQALCAQDGFDVAPALAALCAHAASEHPSHFLWDGDRAQAPDLGVAVHSDGRLEQLSVGSFGLGDEIGRCLLGLPTAWRLAGLLSLAFAEDFAIVDARTGTLPWLAVALPSHWSPQEKVGRHFAQVHAPVADNALLLKASESLMRLVTGPDRWERFVWTITDQPRLRAHPAQSHGTRWQDTAVSRAWFRSEHQTFIALPALQQAVFTIHIEVQTLADVAQTPARAKALHDAINTMSDAVLAYRGLHTVRKALLAWLAARC